MGVRNAPMISAGGPAAMSRSEILANAEQLMGIPYVWGGNSTAGVTWGSLGVAAAGIGATCRVVRE